MFRWPMVEKGNPNHDPSSGRFAEGSKSAAYVGLRSASNGTYAGKPVVTKLNGQITSGSLKSIDGLHQFDDLLADDAFWKAHDDELTARLVPLLAPIVLAGSQVAYRLLKRRGGLMHKFNANHGHDGRFSSGGGSGSGGAGGVRKRPFRSDGSPDTADPAFLGMGGGGAGQEMSGRPAKYTHEGVEMTGMDRVTRENAEAVESSVSEFRDAYPSVSTLHAVRVVNGDFDPDFTEIRSQRATGVIALTRWEDRKSTVVLNEKDFNNGKLAAELTAKHDTKYTVIATPKDVVTHELGHVLSRDIGSKQYGPDNPDGFTLHHGVDAMIRGGKPVSFYGSTNQNEDFAENFVVMNTLPRSAWPPRTTFWASAVSVGLRDTAGKKMVAA